MNELRHPNGLFSASRHTVSTGYDKCWIRDNIYTAIGIESVNPVSSLRTYHTLLDILLKHEYKINWAIMKKPTQRYQYIHARYDPSTLGEIFEEWGNKQNDAIGLFLFKVADLLDRGYRIIRHEDDKRIIRKLIKYLQSIEYWKDQDNGIWEESEELHASSVGACVAGLKKISKYIDVPYSLVQKGQETLNRLLPYETENKKIDLALLSLVYPLEVVNPKQRDEILRLVEGHLVRERGVIRYPQDKYYNKNGEAEWTMGFPWLAIIYGKSGNMTKYMFYMLKTSRVLNEKGELPELYYANSNLHNENSPLGWSQALYLVALRLQENERTRKANN